MNCGCLVKGKNDSCGLSSDHVHRLYTEANVAKKRKRESLFADKCVPVIPAETWRSLEFRSWGRVSVLCVLEHVHACMHVCVGRWSTLGVCPRVRASWFFDTGSLIGCWLANLTRLADLGASGIFMSVVILLCPTPQCWDYKHVTPCLAFSCVFWRMELGFSCLHGEYLADWTASLASLWSVWAAQWQDPCPKIEKGSGRQLLRRTGVCYVALTDTWWLTTACASCFRWSVGLRVHCTLVNIPATPSHIIK